MAQQPVRRWAAASAAAVLATDVVLASYRGVWLAGGVAVLIPLPYHRAYPNE